jgi:serine/threonine protein kinase
MMSMVSTLSSAMAFLESHHVIHRDLAARNVLVGCHPTDVKIADLGAARSVHRSNEDAYNGVYTASTDHSPARWMPLEALREAMFSHKSDVFAFGVLMWEILSLGQTPWGAFSHKDMTEALIRGERLQFPPALEQPVSRPAEGSTASGSAARKIYAIALRCWADSPRGRPHFHQIEGELATHHTVLSAVDDSGRGSSRFDNPRLFPSECDHEMKAAQRTADPSGETGPALDEDGYVYDSTTVDLAPVPTLDEDDRVHEHSSHSKHPNTNGSKNDASRVEMALVSALDDDGYVFERDFPTVPIEGIGTQSVASKGAAGPTELTFERVQQAAHTRGDHVKAAHTKGDHVKGAVSNVPSRVQNETTVASLNLFDTAAGNASRGRAASVYNGFSEDANDGLNTNKHNGAGVRNLSLDLGWQQVGSDRQADDNLHPDETRL